MKKYPRLSVVTVVFNGETHLEQTVRSVSAQTYDNVEYLVIDGGSTDGTLDIIRRYEDRIDDWVSERDGGIYDAMNKGVRYATGDFVAFLNADDWYESDALEAVAAVIEAEQDVEFVYADIKVEGENASYVWKGNAGKYWRGESIPHPACFMKRTLLQQNPFDLTYRLAADYELIVRIVQKGAKMAYLDKVVTNYRVGGASSNFDSRREVFRINKRYFGIVYAMKRLTTDYLYRVINFVKAKR